MNPLRWLWRQMFEDDDSPPAPDQLVLLGEPDGEIVAGFWEGMLKDKGIRCVVKNVNSIAHLRSNAIPMFGYTSSSRILRGRASCWGSTTRTNT